MRQKVESELNELQNKDIIERVPTSEPTPWVSPIVIVPKKGDKNIRICIDMRVANKAIQRERHVTPTIDDILYDLTGARYFSKIDLKKGYHQLELNEKSRQITTFATHQGLFRYKRLNFGINAAAEIFQNEIAKVIQGINGVINISDDLLIYGKTVKEHDDSLQSTLCRLQEKGLTVNKEKCVFGKTNLNFFGHVFSEIGMTPDPHKITAIKEAKSPETPTEVRSLLGMLNFCSRYIPNLATLTQPLRHLTKKTTTWEWTPKHQIAYDKIIYSLSNTTALEYFNKDLKTQIWTDASPVGIAAILTQQQPGGQNKIISFASRALTNTESRYSQIEREALAIVWSIEHYHLYVYGSDFAVVTDHKPLIYLFNNPMAKLSARLERWSIRLQQYSFKVNFKAGRDNPADYLSRHPNFKQGTKRGISDEYAQFLVTEVIPMDITLTEMTQHVKKDKTLQFIMECLRTGHWHKPIPQGVNREQVKAMNKIRYELSVNKDDSLILRGHRLIIPTALQDKAITIAHAGHQGIVKTKQLLRERIWFYGIDTKVEEKIKTCLQCSAATDNKSKLPLFITDTPEQPWDIVSIDHKGPLPSNEYLLVLVDDYSKFPLIMIVNSTSANANIPKLEHIFSIFGIPNKIRSDNGPPFNSQQFKQFTTNLGIQHQRITPLWPQSNGEVERFNRTITKILQIAHLEHSNWKKDLDILLRNYRATPHMITKLSPAELFMNRKINIGLPATLDLPMSPTISKELTKCRIEDSKVERKKYHDSHHRLMDNPKIGDMVLARQERKNKMTTPFHVKPYIVTKVKGPMITSERDGHCITRNATHFKVIVKQELRNIPKEDKIESFELRNIPKEDKIESFELRNIPKEDKKESLEPPAPEQSQDGHKYMLRRDIKGPTRLIEEM